MLYGFILMRCPQDKNWRFWVKPRVATVLVTVLNLTQPKLFFCIRSFKNRAEIAMGLS